MEGKCTYDKDKILEPYFIISGLLALDGNADIFLVNLGRFALTLDSYKFLELTIGPCLISLICRMLPNVMLP